MPGGLLTVNESILSIEHTVAFPVENEHTL